MSTILDANDTQFKLSDSGEILYQKLLNNPLPGEPVAVLKRGDSILMPKIQMVHDDAATAEFLQGWLTRHIAEVLAPLMNLKSEIDSLPEQVRTICEMLFDSLGVIHREQLEDFIKGLDNDARAPLRARKIKMGPVLVFLPELNKPAAVRLKAVLWSLYNDQALPPPTPKDGVVSFTIDPETVNRKFHQVIGYPVFGPRSIRIDMLDRVVNMIYETATAGKFQAQHQMAEWLGCSIDDLYAILRAMGHKQIPMEPVAEAAESSAPAAEEKKDAKPVLASFWIKKGKASEKPQRAKPKTPAPAKIDKPKKKPKADKSKKEPKVFAFDAKSNPEDSPFAVLQKLKK